MEPNVLSTLPFILLLLSIGIIPLINYIWWDKYYYLVSIFFAVITIIYYLIIRKSGNLFHSLEDYVKFISLLTALFIISGGILIELKGYATPFKNVLFLACGAILANIIGTTGASMLLIRPYIKSNKLRITAFHIVFFIFIVSNIGGALTPIGDPPLLMGFIKGIPFFWLFDKIIFKWIFCIVLILLIFYFLDRINFKKQEDKIEEMEIMAGEKVTLKGLFNFGFLAIVILSVFITEPVFLREAIMLTCAVLSYKLTHKEIHSRNHFNFHPIKEVAVLFFGIFITMTPALELLSHHSKNMGISTPSQYFWFTGLLSAFLDNAPAYITFLTASMGLYDLNINDASHVLTFIESHSIFVISISISSVFFGAMTYIGNGPNFMVKSIADHLRINTPGFFGYIAKYSLPVLLPIYFLIWLLFIV